MRDAPLQGFMVLAVALSSACGGGGASPPNEPPRVSLVAPATDVEVPLGQGGLVSISYVDLDPDDVATTDILADEDGNLATTDDQVLIAARRPERDGQEQTLLWNATHAAPGSYRVLARTVDAAHQAVSEATGRVMLNAAPTLVILEPAEDLIVSRGGLFQLRYVDDDVDDAAVSWFYGDRDGDPETVADSVDLTSIRLERDGVAQQVLCGASQLGPLGSEHHISGVCWDGTNVPVTVTAPGRVATANVAWAGGAGGVENDVGSGIAAFADGSCVVTGEYRTLAVFGEGAEQQQLSGNGNFPNAFVARYEADGTLDWAIQAGGTEADSGQGVAGLADGSCVVVGEFRGRAFFGEGTGWMDAAGASDAFVVRYRPNGTMAWARRGGGTSRDSAAAVATGPEDSIVVVGQFQDVAMFGDGTPVLSAEGGMGLFVVRYDAIGRTTWATSAHATEVIQAMGVASLPDGSCVVTGSFTGTAVFGSGSEQTELESDGPIEDVFLARYRADGSLAWAQRGGGGSIDRGHGVSILPDGSCVVVGSFEGTARFGTGAHAVTRTAVGPGNVFIARYDADGALTWMKQAGAPGGAFGTSVAVLPDDSFVVVGGFSDTAMFGDAPDAIGLTAAGSDDPFVARYDADGTLLWAARTGGANREVPREVSSARDGSVVLTGFFLGASVFGEGERAVQFDGWGLADVFVMRLNADGGF